MKKKGYTLIEVIVAVGIIAVLFSMLVAIIRTFSFSHRYTNTKTEISNELYSVDKVFQDFLNKAGLDGNEIIFDEEDKTLISGKWMLAYDKKEISLSKENAIIIDNGPVSYLYLSKQFSVSDKTTWDWPNKTENPDGIFDFIKNENGHFLELEENEGAYSVIDHQPESDATEGIHWYLRQEIGKRERSDIISSVTYHAYKVDYAEKKIDEFAADDGILIQDATHKVNNISVPYIIHASITHKENVIFVNKNPVSYSYLTKEFKVPESWNINKKINPDGAFDFIQNTNGCYLELSKDESFHVINPQPVVNLCEGIHYYLTQEAKKDSLNVTYHVYKVDYTEESIEKFTADGDILIQDEMHKVDNVLIPYIVHAAPDRKERNKYSFRKVDDIAVLAEGKLLTVNITLNNTVITRKYDYIKTIGSEGHE